MFKKNTNSLQKIKCGDLKLSNYDIEDISFGELINNDVFHHRVFAKDENNLLLPLLDNADILISWSIEYQQDNNIISTQICAAYDCKKHGRQLISFILWHNDFEQRFSLAEIVSIVIKKFNIGKAKANNLNISIYSLFSISQYPIFKDHYVVMKHVEKVRHNIYKYKPFTISCNDFNRHIFDVNILFRENMLLAPIFSSLEQISSFTSINNTSLTTNEVSQLFINNKTEFVKYAMNNAYILFEFIMYLNSVFYNEFNMDKTPETLNYFVINLFTKWIDKNSSIHIDKKIKRDYNIEYGLPKRTYNLKFINKENIIKKSYYNNLNKGLTTNKKINDNQYILLNFNFNDAYLSAMATLPLIDWSKDYFCLSSRNYEKITNPIIINHDNIDYTIINCGFIHGEFNLYNGSKLLDFGNTTLPLPEYELLKRKNEKSIKTHSYIFKNKIDLSISKSERENKKPLLAFAYFFDFLNKNKLIHSNDSLINLLYKEALNLFYSNLSQISNDIHIKCSNDKISLEVAKMYKIMTIGIVNAAFVDMLDGLSELKCIPLSTTSNNAIVAVPKTLINMESFEDNKEFIAPYKACPKILEHLSKKKWCSVLNGGRINMGLKSGTWLEIKQHESCNDYIKRYKALFQNSKKRSNKKVDIDKVNLNLAGVQLRGGKHDGIQRQVLRLIVNEIDGWKAFKNGKKMKLIDISKYLDIGYNLIKKQRNKTPLKINKSDLAYEIVNNICGKLNISISDDMLSKLFIN